MRAYALLIPLLVVIGCAQTREYHVEVRNDTDRPITIGLAKDGPPLEELWASPEQVALEPHPPEIRPWGVTIQPGQTGEAGPVRGRFDAGTEGYLRVYAGDPGFHELLAIGRQSPNRLDVLLQPGHNRLAIHNRAGRLEAERLPTDP